ncbi:uncharacterized protein CTHT_0001580 [Thermochaetoides thermophila DSM 1495]|uniref:ORC6 first cyclin-like domain-containing protein n=1 Tax=Chaetomium thermophilum (strain DSM 1495 / CBS 144.50 / IMI 039719) TaxID=759272 RepID=G0RZ37_CHATD|nr:hypothetical protein CTHT_0001580 [Thermochaetoides thermophila DSM 1495]EGS23465.1 hypothetical protein CTHT_0001580 [Thermochaetoides thermophila DSM 1495]
MNRSLEQTLFSLIPTHTGPLPQQLLDLASSLLAQSRHRAATLKPDEEVARPYACAHIACERLKTSLNLPPIQPRPPIGPRNYKRLYNLLDNVLPAGSVTPGRVRTPSAKLREQQEYQRERELQAQSPLAKKTRVAETGSPSKARPLGVSPVKKRSAAGSDVLPRWMRPTLRFLLSRIGPARIGPIVAAALDSIVGPHGKRTEDDWVLARMPAVLGALYMYVWRRVVLAGSNLGRDQYIKISKQILDALARARDELDLPVEAWEDGWREIKGKDLDATLLKGHEKGWYEMDWVGGVKDLLDQGERRDVEEGEEHGEEEREETIKIRKPDTMFQERYDFLSEVKLKKYDEWKAGILQSIKAIQAGKA